ncbi:hypothetical protein MUK42_02084 [Musa troglodytarum]|uniref:Uncharacterized protein n=1 Tax=Musa troglodytarum TaxID=320322 RepID=A0A9E7K652_9LILI|nr:hypothetical protein MUK42_02084 [Musa troglodytarum]
MSPTNISLLKKGIEAKKKRRGEGESRPRKEEPLPSNQVQETSSAFYQHLGASAFSLADRDACKALPKSLYRVFDLANSLAREDSVLQDTPEELSIHELSQGSLRPLGLNFTAVLTPLEERSRYGSPRWPKTVTQIGINRVTSFLTLSSYSVLFPVQSGTVLCDLCTSPATSTPSHSCLRCSWNQ